MFCPQGRRHKRYSCPLCESPLNRDKWLEVTQLWEERDKLLAEAKEREEQAEQRGAANERKKSAYLVSRVERLTTQRKKDRELIRELKRQAKHGTNPQIEGLLYEEELCHQLQKAFPDDKVTRHGQRGDVLQQVRLNRRKVGTLVYECKRVERLSLRHVEQARRAKIERQADFGILVTKAENANRVGAWRERDVVVVHPAAVIVLVHQFRETLLKAARARMTRVERERAVRAILQFVDSAEFRNPLRDIVRRAELLGAELVRERKIHHRLWLDRFAHYEAIWGDGRELGHGFDRIFEQHAVRISHGALAPEGGKTALTYPVRKETLLLPAGKESLEDQ